MMIGHSRTGQNEKIAKGSQIHEQAEGQPFDEASGEEMLNSTGHTPTWIQNEESRGQSVPNEREMGRETSIGGVLDYRIWE